MLPLLAATPPFALLAGEPEGAKVALAILLVFGGAKLMAEVFERLGQPGIVGEILVGVLIAWEVLVSASGVQGFVLPRPSAIWSALVAAAVLASGLIAIVSYAERKVAQRMGARP